MDDRDRDTLQPSKDGSPSTHVPLVTDEVTMEDEEEEVQFLSSYRPASPEYRISSDEEDMAPEPSSSTDEPVTPAVVHEHDRQLAVGIGQIDLEVEEDETVIMTYEDNCRLAALDPEGQPFIGLNLQGQKVTFNNPHRHWYLCRTFPEFCAMINDDCESPGSFNPRCTGKVKDAITQFIKEGHEDIFSNWLQGKSGGPDVPLKRHDFLWSSKASYSFVRTKMLSLKKNVPGNPCQSQINRIKHERKIRRR